MSEWNINWRNPQRNYYGHLNNITRSATDASSASPQILYAQHWEARPERCLNLQNEDSDGTYAYFKLPDATLLPTGFLYHLTNDSAIITTNLVMVTDYDGTNLFRMQGCNVTTHPQWHNIKSCILCLVDNSTSAGRWAHYRNALTRSTTINTTMTKATTSN